MPEPAVVQATRQWKADLLAHELDQMAEMTRRWLQVEVRLNQSIQALQEEIAGMDIAPTREQILRMERYQAMVAQARGQVNAYQAWAEGRITTNQLDMLQLGADQATEAIRLAGVTGNFARINVGALENIVGLCADGKPLFSLLQQRALWPDAVGGLTDALVKGVGLGWNPTKTARYMADGLAQGLNKALQLARTEQMRAYRTASQSQFDASGLVQSYRRICAHDGRVCAGCLAEDGKEYPNADTFLSHVC